MTCFLSVYMKRPKRTTSGFSARTFVPQQSLQWLHRNELGLIKELVYQGLSLHNCCSITPGKGIKRKCQLLYFSVF